MGTDPSLSVLLLSVFSKKSGGVGPSLSVVKVGVNNRRHQYTGTD